MGRVELRDAGVACSELPDFTRKLDTDAQELRWLILTRFFLSLDR